MVFLLNHHKKKLTKPPFSYGFPIEHGDVPLVFCIFEAHSVTTNVTGISTIEAVRHAGSVPCPGLVAPGSMGHRVHQAVSMGKVVNHTENLRKITMFNGKIHYFDWAMFDG
jgi:hypothetical protein